jgi:hypothetical protein
MLVFPGLQAYAKCCKGASSVATSEANWADTLNVDHVSNAQPQSRCFDPQHRAAGCVSPQLKLKVLPHYLWLDIEIGIAMHKDMHKYKIANILRTQNSELVILALEAHYKSNLFSINMCDPRQSIVFEHPPVAYGSFVQRMKSISAIAFSEALSKTCCSAQHPDGTIFSLPHRGLEYHQCRQCRIRPGLVKQTENNLEDTETGIRAATVEVLVEGVYGEREMSKKQYKPNSCVCLSSLGTCIKELVTTRD